ncbi:MAG: 5-methyltetrahydropteroyltriglutamate--homocysteine S-methyltransferase, partial [Acidimicrobiales bacterium]
MARAMNLGMPRIGPARELKRAVEGYWAGTTDAATLTDVAAERRASAWRQQARSGIDSVPSNDFSLYDQVLDTTCLVGAVPERFGPVTGPVDLDTYFTLARGTTATVDGVPRVVAPLEMTKWFDTNYHYLVPELGPATTFRPSSTKPVAEFTEARALGVVTRPVLLGPVTYLLLSKPTTAGFRPLSLLPALLDVYDAVLDDLAAAGARWVQLDEPCLGTDLDDEARRAVDTAYRRLSRRTLKLLVATYFSGLGANLGLATELPVAGLHVDLVRDPGQLAPLLSQLDADTVLSAGVVDGRNVWRTDLRAALDRLAPAHDRLGDRLWVGPSCSLQHVPHDLALETSLPPGLVDRLAFAAQKLDEIALLATGLRHGAAAVADALAASDAVVAARAAA